MRLQLTRALALLGCVLVAPVARADGDWRLAFDSLVYDDSDNVTTFTPRLSVRRRLDEDGSTVGAYALVDVLSAASVDVVSQATPGFSEVRTEAGFDLAIAMGDHLPSASYRFSIEPDYMSHGGRLALRSELLGPDSVLSIAYGLTGDVVGRSGTPWSAFSAELFTHAGEVSLTQTLGPTTVVRAIYGLTVQHGYLEKPYRSVPIFDSTVLADAQARGTRPTLDTFDALRLPQRPPESVPDLRVGHAIGARGLQAIEPIGGSLRLDYQLYLDDWGMSAHAVELALTGQAIEGLRIVGYGRGYVQTAVSFWRREYTVNDLGAVPEQRTLDRDLSSYHALTGGARLEWELGDFAGYVDGAVSWTHYDDYIFLEDRIALLGQVGLRWMP